LILSSKSETKRPETGSSGSDTTLKGTRTKNSIAYIVLWVVNVLFGSVYTESFLGDLEFLCGVSEREETQNPDLADFSTEQGTGHRVLTRILIVGALTPINKVSALSPPPKSMRERGKWHALIRQRSRGTATIPLSEPTSTA
jgi:hypothetical protein